MPFLVQDQSNCSSRRNSLDSQDSWPTIQEAVSPVHARSRRGSVRQSPEVSRVKPTAAAVTPSSSSSSNRRHSIDNGDSEFAANDESSDLECQLNIQKSSSLPSVMGSKLKKPAAKPSK